MHDTACCGGSEAAHADSATATNPVDIRLAAMNLLARREHSLGELRQKLRRRFADEHLLEAELQRLADENLQSDLRYAESFVLQRSGRGYGPLRIKQDMRDKGLDDLAVMAAFESAAVDWYALAGDVFRKKFGLSPVGDIKHKARCSRFMQYRGFSHEHYQQLLQD